MSFANSTSTTAEPIFKTRDIILSLLVLVFFYPKTWLLWFAILGLSKGLRTGTMMTMCGFVGLFWGVCLGLVLYADKAAFIWECDQSLEWCRRMHELLRIE